LRSLQNKFVTRTGRKSEFTFYAPIALTVLCAAVLSLISGCTRDRDSKVLHFSHFWSEPTQRAAMDSLLSGFKREHPEIPIEVTELSWADGKTKLMVGFNAETPPDVMELGSDWVPQFSSSGVLTNLFQSDSLLRLRESFAVDYSKDPGMWRDTCFAIPWLVDTRVMFVNDSLANRDGKDSSKTKLGDWTKFRTLAQKIQATSLVGGVGVNGSDEHRLYKKFLPYVWSNGGHLFSTDGKPTFALPANVEALTYYVEQQAYGTLETQKNLDDAFRRGRLGIWFSGSWLIKALKNATFPWHTEIFPGNNNHPGESFAGGEYLAISRSSPLQKEARTFLAYITRSDNELRFAKAVNMYPADTTVASDSYYLTRREGTVFTEQLKHARMTPVLPKWLEVESILEDEVAQAIYRKLSPQDALEEGQRRVLELLREP
jgi:multiple sugar transport system substrate-binding protein